GSDNNNSNNEASNGNNNNSANESNNNDNNNNNDNSGDKPYVALVSKGFQHQYWQAVKKGAEEAADEFDVKMTFEGPDSESEVEQQIDQLKTALNKNPDALGFAALDSEASAPLLEQAEDEDIPVIA